MYVRDCNYVQMYNIQLEFSRDKIFEVFTIFCEFSKFAMFNFAPVVSINVSTDHKIFLP